MLKTVKPAHKLLITKHLKKLMADAELYGWESLRAYNAVWLQQIENGRVNWDDGDAKFKFHHTLVWHSAYPTIKPKQEHQQLP